MPRPADGPIRESPAPVHVAADDDDDAIKMPVPGAVKFLALNPLVSLLGCIAVGLILAAAGHIIKGGPPAAADVYGFNPRGTTIGDRDNTLQLLTVCPGGGNCCTNLLPVGTDWIPDSSLPPACVGDNSEPCIKQPQTRSPFLGNSSEMNIIYGSRDPAQKNVFVGDLVKRMCEWEATAVKHAVNASVSYQALCKRAPGGVDCCPPRTLPLVLKAALGSLSVQDCGSLSPAAVEEKVKLLSDCRKPTPGATEQCQSLKKPGGLGPCYPRLSILDGFNAVVSKEYGRKEGTNSFVRGFLPFQKVRHAVPYEICEFVPCLSVSSCSDGNRGSFRYQRHRRPKWSGCTTKTASLLDPSTPRRKIARSQ